MNYRIFELKHCRFIAAVVVLIHSMNVMAAGQTRIISADGKTVTELTSLSEAIKACRGGETVQMLDNSETLSADLEVRVDMTLDLGGFTADFGNKLLMPSSNTHLVITNGVIRNLINLNAQSGAVVDLYDASVICGVLATGPGTINVYDGCFVRATTMLSSPWVDGALNIYGGEIYPTVERAAGYENRGVKTTVYGGAFSVVPFNNDYDRFNLAEGRVAICSNYSHTVDEYPYSFHYHVGMNNDRDFVASLSTGVYAEKLGECFAAGVVGDVVTLLKDCTYTARTEIKRDVVFDLGGYTLTGDGTHVISIPDSNDGISAVISNGTIAAGNNSSCIVNYKNSAVTLGKDLTLRGAFACYFAGKNASAAIDGASVETTTMCNFYTVDNASFVIRDGSVINVSKFKPLDTQDDTFAVAEGGLWNRDPAGYVTNNFVKLYRANSSPCKWEVRSWISVCEDGWMFDKDREAPVVTGTCDMPLSPISVRYEGVAPERKTLVADFSGLVLSSSDSLSFVCATGLEKTLTLIFEDAKLYASVSRGFIVVVR